MSEGAANKMHVDLHGGFYFGFWAFVGALSAFGCMLIVFKPIDWISDKFSSHKAHYAISVGSESYVTEDYSRKLSGHIVFKDCDTATQITLPANVKIEITTLDTSTAKVCKVAP